MSDIHAVIGSWYDNIGDIPETVCMDNGNGLVGKDEVYAGGIEDGVIDEKLNNMKMSAVFGVNQ